MGTQSTPPPGFRQISRHDGLFKERVHDAYKSKGKPLEPSVCPQCGAVFHEGRWQWLQAPANAHSLNARPAIASMTIIPPVSLP